MSKDISLRNSFDSEARLYHEIRPRYPEALFDVLIQVTNLDPSARILEIGPGTGQATEALAKRGYSIIAVELGEDLAGIAREVLKKYEKVEIRLGAFEEVEFETETFGLIYVATAFHWIKPGLRFVKSHNLLKDQGYLAIIHANHVSDEAGDAFFFASQPTYKKYHLAERGEDFHLPKTDDLKPEEVDRALFTPIYFHPFPLVVHYSVDEYIRLLQTYSPTIAMEPDMRTGFLKDLSRLIEKKFNGSVLKAYAMTLSIARKKG